MDEELSPDQAWCYAMAARVQAFVLWVASQADNDREIDHEALYVDLLDLMSASYEDMSEELKDIASEINMHTLHIEREVKAFREELDDGLDTTPDD